MLTEKAKITPSSVQLMQSKCFFSWAHVIEYYRNAAVTSCDKSLLATMCAWMIMPLPPLNAQGTLPPGVHSATLDEVFVAFPAITSKRQTLNQALAAGIATIKRLHLADQIALDGSYITDKPEPSDVDLAVLTPGVYQMAGEQSYAAEGIDTHLLDVQFAYDSNDFQQWLTFFSTARNSAKKGVISLIF